MQDAHFVDDDDRHHGMAMSGGRGRHRSRTQAACCRSSRLPHRPFAGGALRLCARAPAGPGRESRCSPRCARSVEDLRATLDSAWLSCRHEIDGIPKWLTCVHLRHQAKRPSPDLPPSGRELRRILDAGASSDVSSGSVRPSDREDVIEETIGEGQRGVGGPAGDGHREACGPTDLIALCSVPSSRVKRNNKSTCFNCSIGVRTGAALPTPDK